MVRMKEFVLNLNKKITTTLDFLLSNWSQVLEIFYDQPVRYYFWWLGYMITRLWNWVQLSIYSTRALFHWLWSTDEFSVFGFEPPLTEWIENWSRMW